MKIHFSPLFKEVLSLSREEAIRLQSDAIGTGHLLLTMIKQGDSSIALLLKQATVTSPDLQREIEAGITRGNKAAIPTGKGMIAKMRLFGVFSSSHPNGVRLSREAEKAIRLSLTLAAHMKRSLAEPEHLFLSILKDKDNVVTGILSGYGLTYELAEAKLQLIYSSTKFSS